LFKRHTESPASEAPGSIPSPRREPEGPRATEPSGERPFDTVARGEQAWQAGDEALAEKLFEQGVDAYRRTDPSGLDFALGRYAAFLLDNDRKAEAIRVLEEAVNRKTDLPAIWSSYVGLIADSRDFEAFKQAVERMSAAVRVRVEPEFLLAHARRADRDGAAPFAEAVARWVVGRTTAEGDNEGRWAAIGDLGRILERASRLEEALKLWREAFDKGSTDPETANRLSMHLERAKDYPGASAVIHDALTRGLPANVEESLRNRLARCQAKNSQGTPVRNRERADVAAYSVRQQSTLFDPVFQLRLKPALKHLELVGQAARCLLVSKESSTLVDIDLMSGAEIRRVENLPLLGDTLFAPDGRGVGVRRTAAIGQGPTLLRFLDAQGHVAAESAVPDATSGIALGPDLWYIGCRDGNLYGFGLDGKKRWAWETPGSQGYHNSAYFRPCPYFVASRESFAAVASMENIYAIGSDGRILWHTALPNERQTQWSYTIPLDGEQGSREAYGILGLQFGASRDEVKAAYRRLALATHPDRNVADVDAAAKFRRVQGAYERVLARPVAGRSLGGGITFSIELQGSGPTASFIAANSEGVVAGSSEGRLYLFDAGGRLREARVLGDSPVLAALRPDGTLGVAWCSNALLFFREDKIVNAAEALEWPRGLTMLGDDVVLWRGNEVQVMDTYGRLLWSVEFSKNVTGIAAHGQTLVCAAGVLAAFCRRGA
jgi:tetratricopeptide (TPR) repeat protein